MSFFLNRLCCSNLKELSACPLLMAIPFRVLPDLVIQILFLMMQRFGVLYSFFMCLWLNISFLGPDDLRAFNH
jgi:hypothetical protein